MRTKRESLGTKLVWLYHIIDIEARPVYVGIADDRYRRFFAHLTEGKKDRQGSGCALYRWMFNELQEGRPPGLRVVGVFSSRGRAKLGERDEIEELQSRGHRLLNSNGRSGLDLSTAAQPESEEIGQDMAMAVDVALSLAAAVRVGLIEGITVNEELARSLVSPSKRRRWLDEHVEE